MENNLKKDRLWYTLFVFLFVIFLIDTALQTAGITPIFTFIVYSALSLFTDSPSVINTGIGLFRGITSISFIPALLYRKRVKDYEKKIKQLEE